MERDAKMMEKWSDHTSDTCAHCNKPTEMFAPTYAFNLCFMICPHCDKENQSAYVNGTFQWIIPPSVKN